MRINYELIEATLMLIEQEFTSDDLPRHDGAVLIFLPGMPEIKKCEGVLMNNPFLGDKSQCSILSLHSVLTSKDQQLVFDKPRRGLRKIVLSTNIAETGI